ncbi:MAG: sulfatase-like hydrolase/transferase [Bythopirellula sp.]
MGVCFSLLCSPRLALRRTDEAGSAANKPNIIFILTDQQHPGMLSCTENKNLKTPALDKLAASGIRFDRAYSANPVCGPSRRTRLEAYRTSLLLTN